MTIVFPLIFKLFFPKNIRAFAFYPFIFLKDKSYASSKQLINHERIHHKQQLELLIVPFYVIYYVEMVAKRFKAKSWNDAYRSISFEKEAYACDKDFEYLGKRKPFAMWRSSRKSS